MTTPLFEANRNPLDQIRDASAAAERILSGAVSPIADEHLTFTGAACYTDDERTALDPTYFVARGRNEQGRNTYVFGRQMDADMLLGVSWTEDTPDIKVVGTSVVTGEFSESASHDLISTQFSKLAEAVSYDPATQTVITGLDGRDKVVRKSIITKIAQGAGW